MLSGGVLRLGPKVTLKLQTSSLKPSNSDSSDQHSSSCQSSVLACPPVEASRSQKKRSRGESDTPTIPPSATPPPRVKVPLRRKITTATDGTSNVGHSHRNGDDSGHIGDTYASDRPDKDWEMSSPADPGAPAPGQLLQLQDDWEMAPATYPPSTPAPGQSMTWSSIPL